MSRKRPFGVMVIVAIHILTFAVYLAGTGVAAALQISDVAGFLTGGGDDLGVVSLGLNIAGLVLIVGLWRLRRWAWVLLMIRLGISMAVDLLAFYAGTPPYLSMVSNVVIVFYLNQQSVQQAFHESRTA